MNATRFRECLDSLAWSQRGLAAVLGIHHSRVRRWAAGEWEVPPEVATWLEVLAAVHVAYPMPLVPRMRVPKQTAGSAL